MAFRSATGPFDTTTPAGRMMVQMLGVFAEFERATLPPKERPRDQCERLIKPGYQPGRLNIVCPGQHGHLG